MICEQVKKALAELVQADQIEPAVAAEGGAATEQRAAVLVTDYKTKGFHLDVAVAPAQVVAAAEVLNQAGFFPEAVTGVDWIAENELEVVYDFNHMAECCRVVIRSRLDRSAPEVPTISGVFPGADWHERETHDFFGIVFVGHPDLSPLLLPEDADFHPLLKDFAK